MAEFLKFLPRQSLTMSTSHSTQTAAAIEIADRVAQNVVALDLDGVEAEDVLATVSKAPYL